MSNDMGEYSDDFDLDDNDLENDQEEPVVSRARGAVEEERMPSLVDVGMSLAFAVSELTETLQRIFPQGKPPEEPTKEEPTKEEPAKEAPKE
jgi:hypothetical protein